MPDYFNSLAAVGYITVSNYRYIGYNQIPLPNQCCKNLSFLTNCSYGYCMRCSKIKKELVIVLKVTHKNVTLVTS
jgi:hypothetical protein